MHSYLKTIGFSNLVRRTDIDEILRDVIRHYDEKKVVETSDHRLMAELSRSYGCDVGITLCGEYDDEGNFHQEYYFPYFRGTGISTREEVEVEKHGGRESYAGACEDIRAGATLFFFLQNVADYLERVEKGIFSPKHSSVTLSGLASEGKVILPIYKSEKVLMESRRQNSEKTQLIREARKGDERARESLALGEIDTYAMLSKRLEKEDILSIVDSSLIPCGIECDQYRILGDIVDVMETVNNETGETVVQLGLCCNDISLDVCINKKDLLGTPQVGFRFKGDIWLQGLINY